MLHLKYLAGSWICLRWQFSLWQIYTYLVIKLANLFKKKTLTQVFSYEFCEISNSNIFTEHLWWLLLEYEYLGNWYIKSTIFVQTLAVFIWTCCCAFNTVLSSKKKFSSFLKKISVIEKTCFKVNELKTFKISSDCRIKHADLWNEGQF